MYRIVLICTGIPAHEGPSGARSITEEFARRPWHKSVSCEWMDIDSFFRRTTTWIQTVSR